MTTTSTPGGTAPAGPAPARPWLAVTREVAGDRVDRIVCAAVAAVAGFGYSVLPFDYTQRVSFANWPYFGPRYAAYTATFALGLAWLVTLQVHAMRRIAGNARGAGRQGGLAGALAAVVAASGVWSVRKLAWASCLAAERCDVPVVSDAAAAPAERPGPGGDREPGEPAHGAAAGQPGRGGGR